MSSPASLESFERELLRLVAKFEKEFPAVTDPGYSEARLRQDYLDPFIRALGWDLENHAGLVQQHREVEIESRTDVAGRAKRADYLFRTDRRDRFVCEAKKPRVTLGPRDAFQAKRYARNKKVHLALLTDFEEMEVYIVGSKARLDEPLAKTFHLASPDGMKATLIPSPRSRQEELGQFLTASPVADFMASMFGPLPRKVRLLDAGAGT